MIVITTPTGQIGRQVLGSLLESGEQLRVIARDPSQLPAGVREDLDIVEGSHGDAAVADKAFAGADQHAFSVLAEEGLIVVRQGRTAVVAGDPPDQGEPGRRLWRPGPGHDCKLSGCRQHTCKPMKANTIRQIHSILSGAFAAAQRWEWVDGNPADSARPPTATPGKQPATPPSDVAKVIAEGRRQNQPALALYLWLAAITGSRRGELCAVQICDLDLDLDRGNLHIGFNYVVRGGQRVRKDTKTHQERFNAIDPDTCAFIREHLASRRQCGADRYRPRIACGRLPVLQRPDACHAMESRLGLA